MTSTTSTLPALTPDARGSLILEPIMDQAVAANPAVASVYSTAATTLRIPALNSDALASWTREAEEIIPSDVSIDEIVVTPAKAAALVPISTELARDSSPSAADLVGRSLSRALIDQLDRAFIGDLAAPAPKGLGALDGYLAHTTDLSNLDVLHQAKADIGLAGGNATALLCSPADAVKLLTLKDSDGSNRNLIESLESLAGLTVVQNRHVTAGEMWVLDAASVASVFREDVEITTSEDVYFTSDRVAVRGTVRVGFAFAAPQHVAKISITS